MAWRISVESTSSIDAERQMMEGNFVLDRRARSFGPQFQESLCILLHLRLSLRTGFVAHETLMDKNG